MGPGYRRAPHLQPLQSPRHALPRRRARTRAGRSDPARRRAPRRGSARLRHHARNGRVCRQRSSMPSADGLVDRARARGRRGRPRAGAGDGRDEPGSSALGHRRAGARVKSGSLDDALATRAATGPPAQRHSGRRQCRRHRPRRGRLRRHRRDRGRRHGGSVRLEGPARRHGQHVPAADRRAPVRGGGGRAASRAAASPSSRPCRGRARRCRRAGLRGPVAILLGGEGAGLPDALVAAADERLSIPMRPPVESFNVAITAALILYEAAKQRDGHVPVRRDPSDEIPTRPRPIEQPGVRSPRRTDAPADARRVHRSGGSARRGPSAATGDRGRSAAIDHPLGTAWHRQDDAGARHRARDTRASSSRSARCSRGSRKSGR